MNNSTVEQQSSKSRFTNVNTKCPRCGEIKFNATRDGKGGQCFGKCDKFFLHERREVQLKGFETLDKYKSWLASKGNTIVETYEYQNLIGETCFAVFRLEPKNFLVVNHDNSTWMRGKSQSKLLYKLPEITKAIEQEEFIFLCEGEKDAESLISLGLKATTNPFGAKSWCSEYTQFLKNAKVILCCDRDEAGLERKRHLVEELTPVVTSIQPLVYENITRDFTGNDITDLVLHFQNLKINSQEIQTLILNGVRQLQEDKPDISKGEAPPYIVLVENWLKQSYTFRFNLVSNSVEMLSKEGSIWRECRDEDYASIHRKMLHSSLKFSLRNLESLLLSDYTERFNPFEDFFNSLPPWNNESNIEKMFNLIHVENSDRERYLFYFKTWLTYTVQCSLGNECNDLCLILTGGQGVGKTTFLRNLIPKELKNYYVDGAFQPETKDSEVAICQNFVINLDELEAMDRKDTKNMKSIISRKTVKVRRVWAKNESLMVRRASFCGSVNDLSFLVDDTGERRFLCIQVSDISREQIDDSFLKQLWAEALHYSKQPGYRLTKQQMQDISNFNERFKNNSVEYELFLKYFTSCENDDPKGQHLMASEIAIKLREKTNGSSKFSERILSRTLQRLGIIQVNKRVGESNTSRRVYLVREREL